MAKPRSECLFCSARLPLFVKLKGGDFCSEPHRQAYYEQQQRLVLERLIETEKILNRAKAAKFPTKRTQAAVESGTGGDETIEPPRRTREAAADPVSAPAPGPVRSSGGSVPARASFVSAEFLRPLPAAIPNVCGTRPVAFAIPIQLVFPESERDIADPVADCALSALPAGCDSGVADLLHLALTPEDFSPAKRTAPWAQIDDSPRSHPCLTTPSPGDETKLEELVAASLPAPSEFHSARRVAERIEYSPNTLMPAMPVATAQAATALPLGSRVRVPMEAARPAVVSPTASAKPFPSRTAVPAFGSGAGNSTPVLPPAPGNRIPFTLRPAGAAGVAARMFGPVIRPGPAAFPEGPYQPGTESVLVERSDLQGIGRPSLVGSVPSTTTRPVGANGAPSGPIATRKPQPQPAEARSVFPETPSVVARTRPPVAGQLAPPEWKPAPRRSDVRAAGIAPPSPMNAAVTWPESKLRPQPLKPTASRIPDPPFQEEIRSLDPVPPALPRGARSGQPYGGGMGPHVDPVAPSLPPGSGSPEHDTGEIGWHADPVAPSLPPGSRPRLEPAFNDQQMNRPMPPSASASGGSPERDPGEIGWRADPVSPPIPAASRSPLEPALTERQMNGPTPRAANLTGSPAFRRAQPAADPVPGRVDFRPPESRLGLDRHGPVGFGADAPRRSSADLPAPMSASQPAPPVPRFQIPSRWRPGLIAEWIRQPVVLSLVAAAVLFAFGRWAFAGGEANSPSPVAGLFQQVRESVSHRAAIKLTEKFQSRFDKWEGRTELERTWSIDEQGLISPGELAIYKPSSRMIDYSMTFLGKIDKKAMSWAFRVKDFENYQAVKLVVAKPGPLPSFALERYTMLGGKESPHRSIPISLTVRGQSMFRVNVDAAGPDFVVKIEDKIVDAWTDVRIDSGGVGFFSAKGESSRIIWVNVEHRNDLIGRFCGLFAKPAELQEGDGFRELQNK